MVNAYPFGSDARGTCNPEAGCMTDKELFERVSRSAGQRAGYKQLVRELGLGGGRERRLLLEQLDRLTASGALVKLDREFWAVARHGDQASAARKRNNWVSGRLDLHRDGYGFVRPDTREKTGEEDIFIPPDSMESAMQGDLVLVELLPSKGDGRRSGRILRVLERRNPTVVGIFHYANGRRTARGDRMPGNFVTPLNARISEAILVPFGAEIPEHAETLDRVLGAEAAEQQESYEDLEGLVVDVAITDWPTATRPARGRVIEVLGDRDAFGVDVEILIRKHYLPHIFPDRVLQEARSVAVPPANDPKSQEQIGHARRDFRDLPIVTIDGETAKDFDDAVLVRELEDGGYELQVHIADVAHYVCPGTALDLEARLRGNSVYFPDRAIPMLPMELSTDVCSLRPNEDRLVLSCVMQLGPDGTVLSSEVSEGVVRSARRMTYTQVHAILEGDPQTRKEFAPLVPEIERMLVLAQKMNAQRERRGSIDFDLPEPVIEFDEQGQMRGVTKSERTWANRLIEEFMLAANECVATWLEDLGVPSIYRIHEKPEPRRVIQFEELAAAFGYSLGLGALPVKRVQTRGERRDAHGRGQNPRMHEVPEDIPVTPRMYQKLAKRIEGKPEERILSYLMLRSLKQARYSEINEGHFALAAPSYTHFTSPIRRYPDLIVHRIAKALLQAGVRGHGEVAHGRHSSPWTHPNEGLTSSGAASHPWQRTRGMGHPAKDAGPSTPSAAADSAQDDRAGIKPPIPEAELAQIAEETSLTERRAADAERELVEWKKVRFMQDRVGEEFAALVLNPAKFGLFVELTDLFVEGLVPIDSLRDDRYTWRENTHEIIGERTSRRFRAGDRVQVILDRILAQERKLQFSIVEEGLVLTGSKTAKSPPKAKKTKRENAASSKGKKRFGKKGKRR
jgi:ribonuclease R